MTYNFTIVNVKELLVNDVHDGYDVVVRCEAINDTKEVVGQSETRIFLGSDRFYPFPPDDTAIINEVNKYMEEGLMPSGKTLKQTMIDQATWLSVAKAAVTKELTSLVGMELPV